MIREVSGPGNDRRCKHDGACQQAIAPFMEAGASKLRSLDYHWNHPTTARQRFTPLGQTIHVEPPIISGPIDTSFPNDRPVELWMGEVD